MKKCVFLLAGLLFTNASHAFISGAFSGISDEGAMMLIALAPTTTTTFPTMIIADSGEVVSITDRLPELEAEIKAGPESYYYIRALATQVSSDEKYNGDADKALTDVIIQVNALIEMQRQIEQGNQ